MAEELRFFLRTGIYAGVIAAIYWFASYDPVQDTYDWAGTALLVAAALAGLVVVAVMAVFSRRALHGRPGSTLAVLGRWLGLADPGGVADEAPLATGLDPIPRASVWPLMVREGLRSGSARSMRNSRCPSSPWSHSIASASTIRSCFAGKPGA